MAGPRLGRAVVDYEHVVCEGRHEPPAVRVTSPPPPPARTSHPTATLACARVSACDCALCACACACVRMRACVRARAGACMRARACVRAFLFVRVRARARWGGRGRGNREGERGPLRSSRRNDAFLRFLADHCALSLLVSVWSRSIASVVRSRPL